MTEPAPSEPTESAVSCSIRCASSRVRFDDLGNMAIGMVVVSPSFMASSKSANIFPTHASSGRRWEVLIYTAMSLPLSRMAAFALAVLLLGTAATASARPKKHSVKYSAERQTTATITSCDGTPIIMQGIECKKRSVGVEEQATKRPVRRGLTARGSGGSYAPAPLSPPTLPLSQQTAAPYIPPPVSNPSAQINQLNHSFPLNGGLGLNPTGRDAFIRYNLTR